MVGSTYGWVYIYLNEGTDENPVLGSLYRQIKYTANERAAPYVVDWNLDGKKDLLVGTKDGRILKHININTDEDPQFGPTDYVYAGGVQFDVGMRANPKMPDWDNDGKRDIITGEYNGNIFFCKNIGTDAAPDFDVFEYIKAGGVEIDAGLASRIDIIDWNNDGLLDMLAGCEDGKIFHYQQEFIFKFETFSYDTTAGTTLKWRSRSNDLYIVYFSDDMLSWTAFPEAIQSQGVETEWTDPTSIGAVERYYMVGTSE